MALDTSIALKAQAPQVNPLQTALQAAQFRLMNTNGQAMQQQLNANIAASEAFKQSTDADGNTDYNKFRSIMAQGAGAYNLPTINNNILEAQQKQQTLDRGAIGMSNDQRENYANSMKFLTQQFATVNPNDPNAASKIMQIGSDAVQQGHISPQMFKATVAQFPDDPRQWGDFVKQKLASFQDVGGQLKTMTPTPTLVDQGGTAKYVDTNALTNPGVIGTQVTKTLTPSEQVSQVGTYQNGQPGTKPLGQVAQEQGFGNLVPGGAPQSAPQASGNGRYPGAQPSQTTPGGFNPTSAPTGEPIAMEGSAKQWDADRATAGGVAGRIYQLQAALHSLEGAGSIGPGTEQTNKVKSFLLAQTPGDLGKYLPGIDPQKIASYDEANKYLTQYASAKAGAFGVGTDAKLATTLSGNASTHISDLAAKDVVKANIGLERMDKAMADAFAGTGLPASQYANWKLQWAGKVDPRVFISDQMEPNKVVSMVKKMSPKEQAQFKTTYNWAVQNGYLEGPK